MPSPRLLVSSRDGALRFLVDRDRPVRLGRTAENDVVAPQRTCGARQMTFTCDDLGFAVRDDDSPGGTYVDDELVRGATRLRGGERIKGGGVELSVELVSGETLAERRRLSAEEVARTLGAIAAELCARSAAERPHGALTPHDLVFAARGDRGEEALLLATGRAAVDAGGALLVNPRHLAPERIGGGPATLASDLFSLASALWEAAAGEPPFDDATPAAGLWAKRSGALRPAPSDWPPALAALFAALLAASPDARPIAGAELAARLQATGFSVEDFVDALRRAPAPPPIVSHLSPPVADALVDLESVEATLRALAAERLGDLFQEDVLAWDDVRAAAAALVVRLAIERDPVASAAAAHALRRGAESKALEGLPLQTWDLLASSLSGLAPVAPPALAPAVLALGLTRHPRFAAAIEPLLAHADPAVGEAARNALAWLDTH